MTTQEGYVDSVDQDQSPYPPNILKYSLSLVLQIFLYLEAFECNTTSDWLNHTIKRVAFKFRKRQRMFLRMVSEYGPRLHVLCSLISDLHCPNFHSRF